MIPRRPAVLAIPALLLLAAPPAPAGPAADPLAGAPERIERHRKGDVQVLVESAGRPLPGAAVTIRQTCHAFLFGCNIFALNPDDAGDAQKQYQARYKALLNYATLPFYWGAYERQRGKPDEDRLRKMARWCRDNGIHVKGHPVVWHTVFPKWIGDAEPMEPLLRKRIRETVGGFKGLVDCWDVVNESLVAPREKHAYGAWVQRLGPTDAVEKCLRWAAEANPEGFLLVNDFKVHPDYEKELADLRARKAPFHAVGIQSHMHGGEWSMQRAWQVCETYAKTGLPIHFTEVTVLSGPKEKPMRDWMRRRANWNTTPEEETKQAAYVERFYTLLFSHPAVEAITWWDFADGHAWMGAPAGFLRKDMSPKPVYERLMKRIQGDWWTTAEAKTGADGKAGFRAFHGSYRVTATGPGGKTKTSTFELKAGTKETPVVRIGL
jgi:GH35 family endo-1,4-beta-xylanase